MTVPTIEDINRLLRETFAHMQAEYEHTGGPYRWAEDRGLSEEILHYVASNVAQLGLQDIIDNFMRDGDPEERALKCFHGLYSGAILAFVLGLEIQKQLLGGET